MNKKNIFKTILFLSISLSLISNSFAKQARKKSFLVDTTPKVSKNGLKEDIGEELKSALHACADMTKKLGEIQQQIAQFQTELLSKVEKLIDNRSPFKKAKQKTLSNSLKTMKEITSELGAQKKQVIQMVMRMNSTIGGKKA